jgi:hypothetical protein
VELYFFEKQKGCETWERVDSQEISTREALREARRLALLYRVPVRAYYYTASGRRIITTRQEA